MITANAKKQTTSLMEALGSLRREEQRIIELLETSECLIRTITRTDKEPELPKDKDKENVKADNSIIEKFIDEIDSIRKNTLAIESNINLVIDMIG